MDRQNSNAEIRLEGHEMADLTPLPRDPQSTRSAKKRAAVRPSDDRVRRLDELARWHSEWVRTTEPHTEYHADKASTTPSNYNTNFVDLDADPVAGQGFYTRAARIMGI